MRMGWAGSAAAALQHCRACNPKRQRTVRGPSFWAGARRRAGESANWHATWLGMSLVRRHRTVVAIAPAAWGSTACKGAETHPAQGRHGEPMAHPARHRETTAHEQADNGKTRGVNQP